MSKAKLDCVIFPGRINPKEIAFVNAILDDHEGMVVCRTEDATEGRIEFWVSPGLVDEFIFFLTSHQKVGMKFNVLILKDLVF